MGVVGEGKVEKEEEGRRGKSDLQYRIVEIEQGQR